MTPEERVAEAARDWDGEGLLTGAALRRLAWRRARSGRTCETCRETKALSEFSRDSRNPDGLRRYCKGCASTRDRGRRARQSAQDWPSTPTSEEGPTRAAP